MGLRGPPPLIFPSVVSAPPHHPGAACRGPTAGSRGAAQLGCRGLYPSARRKQTWKHYSLMNKFLLSTMLWFCQPPSQKGERSREGRCGEGQ